MDFIACSSRLSFTAQDMNSTADGWLWRHTHKETELNSLFFVGRTATWLMGRSDIYTGVKTLPVN
jgi:hypothetical protein